MTKDFRFQSRLKKRIGNPVKAKRRFVEVTGESSSEDLGAGVITHYITS